MISGKRRETYRDTNSLDVDAQEKRLACWYCRTYDRDRRRCLAGKANPGRKHVAITVAEVPGPQTLCSHNPFREPLLLRMYFPAQTFRRKFNSYAAEPRVEIGNIE